MTYSNLFFILKIFVTNFTLVKSTFKYNPMNSTADPKFWEDRVNLTLRIKAHFPDSFLPESSFLTIMEFTYINKTKWFDPYNLPPMNHVSKDTWQFDISYNSLYYGYTCNNCGLHDLYDIGERLPIKIGLNVDMDGIVNIFPMIGTVTDIKFPISQTSTFFQDPPEIVIAPSFDLNEPFHGSGLLTSVDLIHPIFGERNIPIYLPPGYLNPYKRFPVTFVIDASLKYMEVLKPQFGKILTTYITKKN